MLWRVFIGTGGFSISDIVDEFLSDDKLKEAYDAFSRSFDKNPEDNVPDRIEQNEAFSFHSINGWSLVGHGKITNPEFGKKQCGRYYGKKGCLHVERHTGIVTLDGHDHTNQVYVQKVFRYCDNPRCPVCYLHGWAVREARRMEARVKEAERRFGEQAEHMTASVPKSDYGLSFEQLKKNFGTFSMLGTFTEGALSFTLSVIITLTKLMTANRLTGTFRLTFTSWASFKRAILSVVTVKT